MHRIPVHQIMTTDVITIHPEAAVNEAAAIMRDLELRRMPVIDEQAQLIGIVTDSDLREAESVAQASNSFDPNAEAAWLTVADVMSRDVVTICPDATVGQLARLLMQHKIGGVPVVERDDSATLPPRLVGIITETDIFRMIAEAWEKGNQGLGD